MATEPFQDVIDLAGQRSDEAVADLNADAAFRLRDIQRAWVIIRKSLKREPVTEEERAFATEYMRRHGHGKL